MAGGFRQQSGSDYRFIPQVADGFTAAITEEVAVHVHASDSRLALGRVARLLSGRLVAGRLGRGALSGLLHRGLAGLRSGLLAYAQQLGQDLGIGGAAEAVLGRADDAGELAEHRSAGEDDGVEQGRLDGVLADLEALGVTASTFGDRRDGLDVGVDFAGFGGGVGVGLGDPQFNYAASGRKHVHVKLLCLFRA